MGSPDHPRPLPCWPARCWPLAGPIRVGHAFLILAGLVPATLAVTAIGIGVEPSSLPATIMDRTVTKPRGDVMTTAKKPRIYTMSFARVYPEYVNKAERKGRTRAEVDEII